MVRHVYERVLGGSSLRSRHVEVGAGGRVHLLEKGAGPPVVLLHGTGNSAGFLLPLLNELHGGPRTSCGDVWEWLRLRPSVRRRETRSHPDRVMAPAPSRGRLSVQSIRFWGRSMRLGVTVVCRLG